MLVVVPLLTGRALLWSIALPIVSFGVLGAAAGTALVADVRRRELAATSIIRLGSLHNKRLLRSGPDASAHAL